MKVSPGRFLLTAMLLGIPLSSYWLVFRPQNSDIAQATKEIDHKQTMLSKLQEETARNADLERANEDIKKSIDAIEARLPNNKEVDAIVRQVSDLAVEAGLPPPSIKSGKPVKAALYMEQPLELSMEGGFRGFYEFLIRLEKLPRITRIPDMKIKRSDTVDGDMRAEFTLSIYFQDSQEPGK